MHVAVVGAGIMGAATAYALARDGVDVLVLEQFRVGHARGSSHGRTRIVRLAYPNAQLDNPDFEYKVTYTKGHGDNPEGILIKGKSVKAKEGMIFNVSETNKS